MFKRVLIAAAILAACPAFVFSQDIFFQFGGSLPEAGGVPATSSLLLGDTGNASGSVNLYSTVGFDFDASDINFFSSDTNVAIITGGEGFNPEIFNNFTRFDAAVISVEEDGSQGNFFAVNVQPFGGPFGPVINPPAPIPDPLTDPTLNAILLARVDFEIVGSGTTEFSLALGTQGIIQLPNVILSPTFGSATLEVSAIPEPSSAMALMMGCVAILARRKRA